MIESEESVASGVRRITARTSIGAYALLKKRENLLNMAKESLGASSYFEVNDRLNALKNEKDLLKKNNEALSNKLSALEANKLLNEIKVENDIAKLSVEEYKNRMNNADDKIFIDELQNEIYCNSVICIKKMK